MKAVRNLTMLGLPAFSLVLLGCSLVGSGKPSSELLDRLEIGSGFERNDDILNSEGWWRMGEDTCSVGSSSNDHVYLDFSDPSYAIRLEYDQECNLVRRQVERREVNEL